MVLLLIVLWPDEGIPGGNLRTHGIQSLRCPREGGWLEIRPLDTPLVCLWGPKPLDFAGEAANGKLYFNLYNNLWGTNFKMWYDEDILCRFMINSYPTGEAL